MKKSFLILFGLSLFLLSCAIYQSKDVTLIQSNGIQYTGVIKYSDGYSGTLSIVEGPGGESFSGKFVVVDQTSTNIKKGSIIVPQSNQIPAVGGIAESSSGEINATGYWYGTGNKGTKIEGTMRIGIGGHGHGTCKDSKGNIYKIIF